MAEIAGRGLNSPLTSSCGRLFDAVAAMAGGRALIDYEGQAAIELMYAGGRLGDRAYGVELAETPAGRLMMVSPLLRQVAADLKAGLSLAAISQTFQRTLIDLLAVTVQQAATDRGLTTVALAGGFFANRLVLDGLEERLRQAGCTVLTHTLLPSGDGGLALGQAMIGRCHLTGNRPWPP